MMVSVVLLILSLMLIGEILLFVLCSLFVL